MAVRVSNENADQIIRQVDDGQDDPFGIQGLVFELNRAADILSVALAGGRPEKRREVQEILSRMEGRPSPGRAEPPSRMDRITAELLAHHGIDPLVAAWLAGQLGWVAFESAAGQHMIDLIRPANQSTTIIRIDHRTAWMASGNLHIESLGQTVANAAPGMRLSEIVTHPVLDRYDLPIIAADAPEASLWKTGVVRTLVRHEETTPSDLAAIAAETRIDLGEGPGGKTCRFMG